jgi:hypothetical protein
MPIVTQTHSTPLPTSLFAKIRNLAGAVMALLSIICALAAPGRSSEDSFRAMPSWQRSEKACLSIGYDGTASYWLNHCSHAVTVRWIDEAKCPNWSCVDEIAPNGRSSGIVSRHARWCECVGTLKTCDLPKTGC